MGKLDKRLNSLESRLDSLDNKLDSLDNKLDALIENVDKIKVEFKADVNILMDLIKNISASRGINIVDPINDNNITVASADISTNCPIAEDSSINGDEELCLLSPTNVNVHESSGNNVNVLINNNTICNDDKVYDATISVNSLSSTNTIGNIVQQVIHEQSIIINNILMLVYINYLIISSTISLYFIGGMASSFQYSGLVIMIFDPGGFMLVIFIPTTH